MEVLINRYRQELYAFLARFLGDQILAQDVFQETFLQVHLSKHTFQQGRAFRPWLFTVAANKARDAQVYVAKAAEFRAYMLAHAADEGVVEPDDPAVIDEAAYPYLYAEYWNTYDVSPMTPWDLARAGIANADKVSVESGRRRDKLLALAVLAAAPPEIPES